MFLSDCTWVEILLPYKDRFGSQCHLPLYLSLHQAVSFFMLNFLNNVGFIFPLLKYCYRFPHILILDFEYLKRPHIVFLCFRWGWGRNKWSVTNDYYSNQNQQTLILARASAQEFFGLVLYNFITLKRYLRVLINCKTVLWSGALFWK